MTGLLRHLRPSSVALALAAAGGVLALAAAATQPYLAAAGDAATATELTRLGPAAAGLRIETTGAMSVEDAAADQSELTALLGGLGEPALQVRSDPMSLDTGAADQRMRLVTRAGAADHLDLLTGDRHGGLLVPDLLAEDLGLTPGQEVTLRRGDRTATRTIAGVYRTLDVEAAPPELQSLAASVDTGDGGGRPLDLVFGDQDALLTDAAALRAEVQASWSVAAPADLQGRVAADQVRRRLQLVATAAADPRTDLGASIDAFARTEVVAAVGLAAVVREADRAVAAVTGPVRIAGAAGQAVALVVVGMAALFAARQRTRELRLENVRGRSLPVQGVRAGAVGLPWLVLGAAAGWGAAIGIVAVANAPQSVPGPVLRDAALAAAWSLAPAVAVVALTTAIVAGLTVRVGRVSRVRRVRNFPWELVVIALAGVAFAQLRTGGGVRVVDGANALSPLVLAFPFLLLLGAVGLALRGARRLLPHLRRVGSGASAGPYLAVRRLAAASGAGLLLTGAAATALGLVVYTASLSASLGTAVQEKAVLQLGADAVAPIAVEEVGGASPTATTSVLRARGTVTPGGTAVDVLLVSPDTFVEVAFSRPELVGAPLGELLGRLDGDPARLPVIVAGLGAAPAALDVPSFRVPLTTVAHAQALPGQSAGRPLLIASLDAADALAVAGGTDGLNRARWRGEVWAAGADAETVLAGLAVPEAVRTAAAVAAQPRLVAVTWALGALQALAVLATGLALLGILLFVAVRQRDLQVSYALARRMGLTSRTHAFALAVEVLALLLLSLGLATVLGLVAAAAVGGGIDPLPELLPGPRVVVPGEVLLALAGALAVAGVAGAAALQRGADRANVAEVLRRV